MGACVNKRKVPNELSSKVTDRKKEMETWSMIKSSAVL